jgi:phosphopantetheine adenylyltransferase
MQKQKYSRTPEAEDELTYSQEMAQQEPTEQLNAEEESYKKRYQDIQRHIQTVRDQKDQELAEVKKQLDAATRKQIRFPKTDEEVEAWSNRYPDVAKIVDTIARKRANEALQEGEQRLKKVENFEKSLHRQTAEQQLMQLHPDFAQIRSDPKFHEWVALQPSAMQDSVYKNNTDATWAARTIDLYKADTGKRRSTKSAAQAVGRTSSSAPSTGSKATFSESMVQAMSDREYEANEEAINAAISTGKFAYDISGAAR